MSPGKDHGKIGNLTGNIRAIPVSVLRFYSLILKQAGLEALQRKNRQWTC